MARLIRTTAILTVAVTIFFSALYRVTRTSLYLTLSITCGTLAYHVVMRMIVGEAFDRFMNKQPRTNPNPVLTGIFPPALC